MKKLTIFSQDNKKKTYYFRFAKIKEIEGTHADDLKPWYLKDYNI